jgi:hypothetical protein
MLLHVPRPEHCGEPGHTGVEQSFPVHPGIQEHVPTDLSQTPLPLHLGLVVPGHVYEKRDAHLSVAAVMVAGVVPFSVNTLLSKLYSLLLYVPVVISVH